MRDDQLRDHIDQQIRILDSRPTYNEHTEGIRMSEVTYWEDVQHAVSHLDSALADIPNESAKQAVNTLIRAAVFSPGTWRLGHDDR